MTPYWFQMARIDSGPFSFCCLTSVLSGATADNVSVIPGATSLDALQAAVEKARGGVKKGG
ncbi:hypothetical protein [Pantoea endophytica]|uniref:hypothetical protein n=1 Tax=Pantoea endophytica TaxID=92488 RepID=UPI0030171E14